jgi:hypothetical protein
MTYKKRLLAIVLLTLLCVTPARAALFGGSHAPITDYDNGSEVSTNGTLVSAVNLLNDTDGVDMGPGVSTTINGVLFQGTQPGQFFEGGDPSNSFGGKSFVYHGGENASGSFLWNSGGAYETLARSQIYNTDDGNIDVGDGFGVVNLTPGIQYELQVFMLDDRAGIAKTFPLQFQQVQWAGNLDQLNKNPDETVIGTSIGFMPGITIGGDTVNKGEIATVKLSIDPEFNGLLVNTWDNGAFNGMQLRSLGPVGDYDGNGSVGPEDYDTWKANFGSTEELAADGNVDGIVDAADYTIWRDRLSEVGGGALNASTVPEPSETLLGISALGFLTILAARGYLRRRTENLAIVCLEG